MRLTKLFTLIEQADPNKIYVIGDSHAVAIGQNIRGAEVLAKNGAKLDAIQVQAQAVPDGSKVLVTGGNNDWNLQDLAAGSALVKILQSLKSRNCKIIYVGFPPIDLNGIHKDVYVAAGYTANYNRVQQRTVNMANTEIGSNNVTSLGIGDINPSDPMKIHAKPAAYSRIANNVVQKFQNMPQDETQSQQQIDQSNLQLDLDAVPSEDLKYLDPDGDGVVTVGDAQELGLKTEIFSSMTGDAYGIFGVLQNFINKTKPVDINNPAYKTWINQQRQQFPEGPPRTRNAGVSGNAGTALRYFESKGFTPEQAAGIVGNLQAESGVNINPAAIGDGGAAWGIAQWHPDRRAIWERANNAQWQSNGSSPNFQQQLDFIMYELQRTESRALRQLRATTTVQDAAASFDRYYERSSGQHRQRRIELAQALLNSGSTQTADASGVPTNGSPLFGLDGSQSRMTQDDAAEQMAQTLARYRRMVASLPFQVRVNDAIAKSGTSRETQTPGSQHFHGTALDLSIAGLSQDQVKQLLAAAKSVGFTGFGFGSNILHVDSGPKRVWDYGNRDFAGMSLNSVKNWAMA